jgi:hypothetical protein
MRVVMTKSVALLVALLCGCGSSKMIGEACTADGQCMSGLCQVASGTCRKPNGMACTAGTECGSDACIATVCAKIKLTGEACTAGPDCASGTCTASKCEPWKFAAINTKIFKFSCTFSSCHTDGSGAAGGLDLKTDPYAALVNKDVVSTLAKSEGKKRVVPNDAAASFIYTKLTLPPEMKDGKPYCREFMKTELATSYGGCMPSTNPPLDEASIDAVKGWINAGAKND